MAIVSLPRGISVLARELPFSPNTTVMDAVGESTAYIGPVLFVGGPASAKTISNAGGRIHFAAQSVIFANAGSNLRIGIQDRSGNTEDGVYDVNGDFVPGTDTFTSDTTVSCAMSTGSKTINHGDIVCVVIEWTARAGADSIRPYRNSSDYDFPYCTQDTGGGPGITTAGLSPLVLIEFDDGTFATMGPATAIATTTTQAFNQNSTPDEYAMIFSYPITVQIDALFAAIGDHDANDDGEIILYSDPLGTPTVERTVTIGSEAGSQNASGSQGYYLGGVANFTLVAGTTYAIAYRPTTGTNRNIAFMNHANAGARAAFPFGTSVQTGSRTNQTGAFGSLSSTTIMMAGFRVNGVDVPSGGSGGPVGANMRGGFVN